MTSMVKTYVALLSGINVGGNRIVRMADLRAFFEALGFIGVQSYVQSGNVVFRAADGDAASLAWTIEDAFEKKWGFRSRIMVRDAAWFDRCVAENPYPELAGEPKKLHLYVLEREPTGEEEKSIGRKMRRTGKHFTIKGDAFYLKAPNGLGIPNSPI